MNFAPARVAKYFQCTLAAREVAVGCQFFSQSYYHSNDSFYLERQLWKLLAEIKLIAIALPLCISDLVWTL